MRRLLSNSLIIFLLFFISCINTKNKTTDIEDGINSKQAVDSIIKTNANYSVGDTVESHTSNTESSSKGSGSNKGFEIKHNSPNQAEIDSIKQAKTKGKR